VGLRTYQHPCICIVTLKNLQKIAVFQNVPDLDLSDGIAKVLILTDRSKAQRMHVIRPIKCDVTE
jgi:hypothetical protein